MAETGERALGAHFLLIHEKLVAQIKFYAAPAH